MEGEYSGARGNINSIPLDNGPMTMYIIGIYIGGSMAVKARKKRIEKTGRVSRWGNSLGVRIPQEAVDQLRLKDGETVTLLLGADSITIRPGKRRKKWTEAELLKGVTPEMVGGEVDWGAPVGKEI